MFRQTIRHGVLSSFTLFLVVPALSTAAAQQWAAPTREEMSMTSEPKAPGAAAVYLFREEKTDDRARIYSEYVRLKILTEGGKDKANVELKYLSGGEHSYLLSEIAGRTIHPDGTVIPFTGKPYDRTVVKLQGWQYKAKVFTLPDVTVGSIIEYQYKLILPPNNFIAPDWIVQTDTFLRKGHFLWRTTEKQLETSDDEGGKLVSSIAWLPILPAGLTVKQSAIGGDGSSILELNAENIAPSQQEEHMPPISSLGYRVMTFYSPYKNADEFWKGEGKRWAKSQDKFIGPGPKVNAAVQQLVTASDTQEQKLRKIYAAVERFENTDFTRERSRSEDKSEGLSDIKTTDQILVHERGSSNQIAELFIAMARAAGMKAYAMQVVDRSRRLFLKPYLSISQLSDELAIVSVDGHDHIFDPGSRYCPYGHISWNHTDTGGLREIDGGTILVTVPGEGYQASQVVRVANLTMNATGIVTGKVDLKYVGAPALLWRHKLLTDDKDAVEREIKQNLEEVLPNGIEIKQTSLANLDAYEEPLTVRFEVRGQIGSPTGKRLLIPADLFEANTKASFPREKRDLDIWFNYRYSAQDAIRINLPSNFQIESLPPESSAKLQKNAAYSLKLASDASGVTIHRDFALADIFYAPGRYSEVKTFYSQFEAKDQDPVVLKVTGEISSGEQSNAALKNN